MTLQEFTQLTGVKVSNDEFWSINEVYNNSEVTKQEFCQIWCKMNCNRVAEAKAIAQKEAQKDSIREKTNPIILKIKTQIDKYNREGNICKSAVLTEKEKNFLLKNNLVCENSFEYTAGALLLMIKNNLKCI